MKWFNDDYFVGSKYNLSDSSACLFCVPKFVFRQSTGSDIYTAKSINVVL